MTMKERIASGKLFSDYCEGLPEERNQCKRNLLALNATGPDQMKERFEILEKLFGEPVNIWMEPPFYCCYGTHIKFKGGAYINFNCNFVDDGTITIGDKVMFGPAVTIATVGHPLHPDYRGYMYTDPVTIEDNCWIGGNVTICPGVTIGENSVIGAGSVVTKDIPANCVAAGNPCKVIRFFDERDEKFYYKDRPILAEDLAEEMALRDGK